MSLRRELDALLKSYVLEVDRPTIVIVDDDDEIRENLQDIVELAGYPVVAMPNGKRALDYLRRASHTRLRALSR